MTLKNILQQAVLMIAVTLSSAAMAEQAFTLEDCINLGMENNPAVHSSRMSVKAARAQVSEINAARLPKISLSAGYTRLSEVDPLTFHLSETQSLSVFPNIPDYYSSEITITQPLFTGFKLEKSAAAGRQNTKAADHDLESTKRNIELDITTAYWNLVKAHKYLEIINEEVQRQEKHLTDVNNLFDQGLATRNDVLRIEVQHSNALLQQVDADNAVKLARTHLENVVGKPLTGEIDLTVPASEIDQIEDLPQLLHTAQSTRPEAMAMAYRVRAAKTSVGIAKADWLPQIALVGSYTYDRPNERIQPMRDEFNDTWCVGAYLTYDIWNWLSTKHKTDQAKASYAQAVDAQKQLSDMITLQVTSDYLNLQRAIERIDLSRKNLDQAEESYRIMHDLYQHGMSNTTDMLDASVMRLQAETNHSTALIDFEIAKAQLRISSGE